jgi:Fes/CIP4, and EFC/F-BAR homology domain
MGKYADDLWDGFEVVYKRCSDGKDFCKKLQVWYHKRAAIEHDYAKHLAALSKAAEQDLGSVGTAWETVKVGGVAMGKCGGSVVCHVCVSMCVCVCVCVCVDMWFELTDLLPLS